jgi:hypothetical protein
LGIAVSFILSMWPSHRIRWLLINLTIFSPLIMSSNSSFRRILHNWFSRWWAISKPETCRVIVTQ